MKPHEAFSRHATKRGAGTSRRCPQPLIYVAPSKPEAVRIPSLRVDGHDPGKGFVGLRGRAWGFAW